MDEATKLILEQILNNTEENRKDIKKLSESVICNNVILQNQNEILKDHSNKIENNNDQLHVYNKQLEIHIQRTNQLEDRTEKLESKSDRFDNHMSSSIIIKSYWKKFLNYGAYIVSISTGIIAVLKYFFKLF